jgi:carboxypeptidase C (cathepsin A)
LIENLKDETCIKTKLSLGNKIFYKNKIQGVFPKNNKKNKKNKKAKYFYYLQENLKHNPFIYFETNIEKQKK